MYSVSCVFWNVECECWVLSVKFDFLPFLLIINLNGKLKITDALKCFIQMLMFVCQLYNNFIYHFAKQGIGSCINHIFTISLFQVCESHPLLWIEGGSQDLAYSRPDRLVLTELPYAYFRIWLPQLHFFVFFKLVLDHNWNGKESKINSVF